MWRVFETRDVEFGLAEDPLQTVSFPLVGNGKNTNNGRPSQLTLAAALFQ